MVHCPHIIFTDFIRCVVYVEQPTGAKFDIHKSNCFGVLKSFSFTNWKKKRKHKEKEKIFTKRGLPAFRCYS